MSKRVRKPWPRAAMLFGKLKDMSLPETVGSTGRKPFGLGTVTALDKAKLTSLRHGFCH